MFAEGLFEGEGKMWYANGNVYEGQWSRDERSGTGTMHYHTTGCVYRGQWVSTNVQDSGGDGNHDGGDGGDGDDGDDAHSHSKDDVTVVSVGS